MSSHGEAHGLAVVMPCLNDWISIELVLRDLSDVAGQLGAMNVYVIDDGSTESPPDSLLNADLPNITVKLVRLYTNLGHQRALCVGMVTALKDDSCSHIVLMDSDGEDRPTDIPRLMRELGNGKSGAAVALRRRRHAGGVFRILNRAFQWTFRVLTGKALNFGNFMVLPRSSAVRLVNSTD